MANYKIRGVIVVKDDVVYIQGHKLWNLGNLLDEGDEVYIEIEKPKKVEVDMETEDMLKLIDELKQKS